MEDKKFPKKDDNKISLRKKIIIASVVIISIILLIIITQISFFAGLFDWLVVKIRVASGLGILFSQSIAFIVLGLMFGTSVGNFVWSFFPVPQKNKKLKRFICLSVMALICFASFFVSRNVYFNPSTGQPVKYYVVSLNNEYEFYNSPGFDTKTGKKLKPVIKEVIIRHLKGEPAIDFPEAVPISITDIIFKNNSGKKKMVSNKPSHSVVFENKSDQSICILISSGNDRNSEVIARKILSKKKATIDLDEGEHVFACIREDLLLYDSKYYDGKFLKSTRGQNSFRSLPYTNADNKKDFLYYTFFIKINDANEHLVVIKNNSISYNQDNIAHWKSSTKELLINFWFPGAAYLFVMFLLRDKKKKKLTIKK